MAKQRVYELAKEYGKTSKDIIELLSKHNVTIKNHMSTVDDHERELLDRTFKPKGESVVSRPPQPTVRPTAENFKQESPNRQQTEQPNNNQRVSYHAYPPQQRSEHQQAYHARPQQQPGQNTRPPQQPMQTYHARPQQQGTQGNRPPQQQYSQQNSYQARPSQQGMQGGNRPPQQQNYNSRPPQQSGQGGRPQQPQAYNARPPQQSTNQGAGQRPPYAGNRPPYQAGPAGAQQQMRPRPQAAGGAQPYNRPQGQGPMQGGGRPGGQPPRFQNGPATSNPPQTGQTQQARPAKPPKHNGAFDKGRGKFDREEPSKFSQRRPGKQGSHRGHSGQAHVPHQYPKLIKLDGPVSVKELAAKMGRQASELIKKLLLLGIMATINQEIDLDTAAVLAAEFDVEIEQVEPELPPDEVPEIEDDVTTLQSRPPVVTIMGHVDHGKTSLLDVIRKTNVTASEAGGITQHIGAYQVNYKGKKITFLDTPGHEAFTSMRARGAQVTDIAILVVAADDGVMPQTIEAINHSKDAKVPIIVAINKMDKEGANPDRIKQQLSDHGLVPEDWGGDVIMAPVSAHKKTGLNELLEMILLVAEMEELKANPNRMAVGTVIEAKLDKGRGPVATILVQKGTLRVGDPIVVGTAYGKVRAMNNDRAEKVKKAEPSFPVEILGLNDVPQAGDIMNAVEDEKAARLFAEARVAKRRVEEMKSAQKISLDDLFQHIKEGEIKELNLVIKADVQGSVEALRQSLERLKNAEVRVNVIHGGVGAVNESDIMLASASNAIIIAFNVRPDANARKSADNEKVDIRTYRVIYDAINDVEAALTGMLTPELREAVIGRLEVRKVISIPKGVVAGSYVTEGKVTSNSQARVIRNGIVIYEGRIEELRRFKDNVKEVATGYECGVTFEKFRDIKETDIIEAYVMEQVKPQG